MTTLTLTPKPTLNKFHNGYLLGNFTPQDLSKIMEIIKRDS